MQTAMNLRVKRVYRDAIFSRFHKILKPRKRKRRLYTLVCLVPGMTEYLLETNETYFIQHI